MPGLRTGHHPQRGIDSKSRRWQDGAFAHFKRLLRHRQLCARRQSRADAGARIERAAAQHQGHRKAAGHRQIADAAAHRPDAQPVARQQDGRLPGRQAFLLASFATPFDAARDMGQRDAHSRPGAQGRADQTHFQHGGTGRIAHQGIEQLQRLAVEGAGKRHAEMAVAGPAEILNADRRRAGENFQRGAHAPPLAKPVIPAQAGIQGFCNQLRFLDFGLRRNDRLLIVMSIA